MNDEQMWEDDDSDAFELVELDQPAWVNSLTPNDVIAICEGGCASGAYMPAVTYYTARNVMAEHGDAVLEYIEANYGELPKIPDGESWSGIAVFFLSMAVELLASELYALLEDYEQEHAA